MKEETDIKQLLDRFHKGISTPEENKILQSYLEENNSSLEELARDYWLNETGMLQGNAAESLSKLHASLGFEEENQNRGKYRKVIRMVARYAAIFIVGFGLAWFFVYRTSPAERTVGAKSFKVYVGYGSKSTVELPDGSIVSINSGSSLSCDPDFEKGKRIVTLNGEAYFEVKHDTLHPFFVKTKDITVKVLGTKFNVKSYADEISTETTLVTGKVEILTNGRYNDKGSKPIFLAPNQKAIYTRGSNQITVNNADEKESSVNVPEKLTIKQKVKTEIETSWKNNILVFNSEPFSEIATKLERWYNVEIDMKNSSIAPVVFSGKFDKEDIREVLRALSMIEPFKYEINKNKITIYR